MNRPSYPSYTNPHNAAASSPEHQERLEEAARARRLRAAHRAVAAASRDVSRWAGARWSTFAQERAEAAEALAEAEAELAACLAGEVTS